MSVCNWLDVNIGICTGEILFDEAIIEILNPTTHHDGESESEVGKSASCNDYKRGNICNFHFGPSSRKNSSLAEVTKHLDSEWTTKKD